MRNASKKAKKKIFPDTNFSGRNLLLSIFVVLTIFLNLLLHFYLIRNHAQREVIHSNALVSSINVYLSRLEEASILANTLSFSSSEQTDRALSLIKKLYHASVVFIMDAQGDVIASTPYDAAGTTDFETYFSTHPEEARKLINKGKILDVNLYSQTLYGVNSKEHLLQNTHALFSTQPISSVIHQLATIATEPDDLSGTTIHSTIDGRELQLEYHIRGTGEVYADSAIYSVLDNIVSNAVKHSGTDRIDITVDQNQNLCIVRIVDYGRGIPDEMKTAIFEEGFHYGPSGRSGIGLYIVKKTIERYYGSVHVEDADPRGTAVVISLRSYK